MKESFILTIKAEDRPGLLHRVTGLIERKNIRIKSLNLAPTDIHDIVMIAVEIIVSENELVSLALKLEKIIEIFSVKTTKCNQSVCLRVAYFKISKTLLDLPEASVLQKYGAVIINWYKDAFLLAKYGSDTSIRELYNELDSPHLLGFTQTGLISDQAVIDDMEGRVIDSSTEPIIHIGDQSSVISGLAA
ncbi:MAG: hypothetical protein JWR50_4278 [Mucilaginibacter sp.]|nr:hypothetical protein [Mucilaginibacter sp.]